MAFRYCRPDTIETAAALAGAGGRILAGGQSLMPLVLRGAIPVEALIDINALPDLDRVAVVGEWIEIGALARLEPLRRHPLIAREAPLLARALDWVANPAIRERGTLVGNLVHNGPGAEAAAAAALMGARLVVWSSEGVRRVGLGETVPADFVEAVALRRSPPGTRAGFSEGQRRFGHVCGIGCGIILLPNGSVEAVFAGLTDAPMTAPALGAALTEGVRQDAPLRRAIAADLCGRRVRADLHADADYRLDVAPVLARRALAAAEAEGASA